MFEKLGEIWEKYGFEILLGISILIIIIYALCRIGKKGSWSTSYKINDSKPKRRPPQDSKGELECRRVIEEIFGKPFPKARPDILRNPVTGGEANLELDCYNPELKIAVEYNGIQHYKYTPFFHKNKEAFHNQKYRDYMKRVMCRENGITLVEVPYTVKLQEIRGYIIKILKRINAERGSPIMSISK
jgi:hypothetical protein